MRVKSKGKDLIGAAIWKKINKLVDTLYKGKSKGRRILGKIKVSWLKKIMNDLKKLKVEIEKAPDEND